MVKQYRTEVAIRSYMLLVMVFQIGRRVSYYQVCLVVAFLTCLFIAKWTNFRQIKKIDCFAKTSVGYLQVLLTK